MDFSIILGRSAHRKENTGIHFVRSRSGVDLYTKDSE